jgi:cytochrome c oxidase subunit II
VMLLVLAVIVYSIVKFGVRRAEDAKQIPHQTHGHTLLEIGWTLVPVILVILIAVPTVQTIFATEYTIPPENYTDEDVIVRATGYQWWFKFEYPQYGVVTSSELHIPVGRRIIVELDTADVLHSFWAPNLKGKRDMIPNQGNQVWFSADAPGVFFGQCAELCLGAHAFMRFRVIASEQDDFDAWIASYQEAGTVAQQVQADPDVERGRQLASQKGCVGCHTIHGHIPGVVTGSPQFPELTNWGQRLTVGASIADNTLENLTSWIRDPQQLKPGTRMPTLWAHDDPNAEAEARAIATYLLSLGASGGGTAAAIGGDHGDR